MAKVSTPVDKPLHWIASAKRDLLAFEETVIDDIGYALGVVLGGTPGSAKPWKGEGGGVFEIVEDYRGDTYRAVYTVRFARAIYVLHCFQKKSPTGIKTAKTDVDLIRARLKIAQADYEANYEKNWH
jgi:phage-related protein